MAKRRTAKKKKFTGLKWAFWILLGLICLFVYTIYKQKRPKQTVVHTKVEWPKGFEVGGIDISHHNGDLDWELLKQHGLGFVYMKATEGVGHKDKRFEDNYASAQATNTIKGVYHFFRFKDDGREQAEYFFHKYMYQAGDLPPALDVEYSCHNKRVTDEAKKKIIRAQIAAFDSAVFERCNMHCIIYTNQECYRDLIKGHFEHLDLWICDLCEQPNDDEFPNWIIWQYAHTGELDGFKGKFDMNVFYADKAVFDEWRTR